ncbi:hypothetical protein ONZ45_g18010 [Pleurotus djamor]|nr:hypothetical protein ONZ45_g18010 [Pleurotus djamor]
MDCTVSIAETVDGGTSTQQPAPPAKKGRKKQPAAAKVVPPPDGNKEGLVGGVSEANEVSQDPVIAPAPAPTPSTASSAATDDSGKQTLGSVASGSNLVGRATLAPATSSPATMNDKMKRLLAFVTTSTNAPVGMKERPIPPQDDRAYPSMSKVNLKRKASDDEEGEGDTEPPQEDLGRRENVAAVTKKAKLADSMPGPSTMPMLRAPSSMRTVPRKSTHAPKGVRRMKEITFTESPGDGDPIALGTRVRLFYVLQTLHDYEDLFVFHSEHIHPSKPIEITVGNAYAFFGLSDRLVGMMEDGERRLIIPPTLIPQVALDMGIPCAVLRLKVKVQKVIIPDAQVPNED